jgi:CheY-like chemotaxis protein
MNETRRYVLVVDDDPDIRETLELALGVRGYNVHTASDGAEALEQLRTVQRRPCVILMDLMMPTMNGFDLRNAMASHEDLAAIPVVVVTGGGPGMVERAAAMRLEVLRKPLDLTDLIETVGRYCAPIHAAPC